MENYGIASEIWLFEDVVYFIHIMKRHEAKFI